MTRIDFGVCTLEWNYEQRKATCRFLDGSYCDAIPHNTPQYRGHAAEKATGEVDDYCWQHEVAHIVIGLVNGGVSKVLWALAHGEPIDTPECNREEVQAQQWQRQFFRRAE